MKYLLLFFLSLSQISCSKNMYDKFDYGISVNPWKNAFKDLVFYSALKEAYKSDSSIFKSIEKKDAFNTYDGLSLAEMQQAKALGENIILKMLSPSMCEGCTTGMNYFMSVSLHYYKSRELESIANKLYKNHIRKEKN